MAALMSSSCHQLKKGIKKIKKNDGDVKIIIYLCRIKRIYDERTYQTHRGSAGRQ